MATEKEASVPSCTSDPNFAVICSFLEKFSVQCGIAHPSFSELQEMLEDTAEVAQVLIDLHIKLMRKARKTISVDKWERGLSKFCHTYSQQDGWELERFGYKKSQLSVKLRLLKNLLDLQFDCNNKFKTEVNKLNSVDLRVDPLGRDQNGLTYWCQFDPAAHVRVYREDPDEETWHLVAKDRNGLVTLIDSLSSGEGQQELNLILNEDSTSQEIEKPITDTGQVPEDLDEEEGSFGEEEEEIDEEEEEVEEEEEEIEEEEETVNDDLVEEDIVERNKIKENSVEEKQVKIHNKEEKLENENKILNGAQRSELSDNSKESSVDDVDLHINDEPKTITIKTAQLDKEQIIISENCVNNRTESISQIDDVKTNILSHMSEKFNEEVVEKNDVEDVEKKLKITEANEEKEHLTEVKENEVTLEEGNIEPKIKKPRLEVAESLPPAKDDEKNVIGEAIEEPVSSYKVYQDQKNLIN